MNFHLYFPVCYLPKKQNIKSANIACADVIELSSSDEDVVCVSNEDEEMPEEEEDEEEAEDPNNSGQHVNDEFNQPDLLGRVLVNVGHPPDEPDVFLAPQIARAVKPHQVGRRKWGFRNGEN